MAKNVDVDRFQYIKDKLYRTHYKLDDRFIIKDGKKHKCAIICPGGAYAMVCSFIEGTPIARKLNEKGISCVICYYRCMDKAKYPAPQDDLAQAVKDTFARAEEWNLDMDGYSIWGSSAGGHLVASFGTDNMGYSKYQLPKPGALVLIYPVITMEKELTHMGTHDNLLGADASQEMEDFASVEKHVTAAYPPAYVWCGGADSVVPPENTKRMVKALETAGIKFDSQIVPGVDHGVGPATGLAAEGWIDKAFDFWMSLS